MQKHKINADRRKQKPNPNRMLFLFCFFRSKKWTCPDNGHPNILSLSYNIQYTGFLEYYTLRTYKIKKAKGQVVLDLPDPVYTWH